jgi:adenylate cyclase
MSLPRCSLRFCRALFFFRRPSIDFTALRWHVFGNQYAAASSPTVVVVIDEATSHTPPFAGMPSIVWTREIGRILTAIIEGGAKVVGFDIVYPASIEQSEIPFDGQPLGARLHGFDRNFLRALAMGARAGKLVLGEVQHRTRPIRPSPGQRIAVGRQANIRALNAYNDSDDVIRRLPLTFLADDKPVPSMSVELASRALGQPLRQTPDGVTALGDYRIPSAVPNTFTLNFSGGADDIPTYSLADLWTCAEKGDTNFFHYNFNGKVVLIGTLLDVEDRKATSKRFATGIEGSRAPHCSLPTKAATAHFRHSTIAGVYIHATGVNNLLRQNAVVELGTAGRSLVTITYALLAAVLALLTTPVWAVLAYLGLVGVGTAGATWAFTHALALPLAEPALAGITALAATVSYRFVVAEKQKRFLRRSFEYYLAPSIVEKLLASNKPPVLGGEMRNITIFISDLAGFTSIAEKMSPTELVALASEYLSAMSDLIEAQGGFVDKYIGDSIVAVFGAPVDDPDHASNAVRAALECRKKLAELNRTSTALQGVSLSHRIGLNSGEALVGNIGSKRRFNYTVMSDAVNLASRLEGANKYFGTSIIASEMTVKRTGSAFSWREVDEIRVKGRMQPVKIFELLDMAGQQTQEQTENAAAYAEGLARWRNRDFKGAMHCFERVADFDKPSALFLARAKAFAAHPPGADWEPVSALEGK